MISKFFIIIIFISKFSLAQDTKVHNLQIRWASAISKRMDERFLTREPISKPKGVRVVIGEIDLLTKDWREITDCIIYEIPKKGTPGKLFVIQKKSKISCEERKFAKAHLEISEIYNLAIQENSQSLKFLIDKYQIEFDFFNIVDHSEDSESSSFKTKVPGTFVSFVESTAAQKRLSDFDVCSDVPTSDNCSENPKGFCHLCPNGNTYKVVASNCRKSLRTYCGYKECGSKGQPACVRGRAATGYKGPFCITDSPMAYCQKPARVVCLNNELFCR